MRGANEQAARYRQQAPVNVPYVWTMEEIRQLPAYGERDHAPGWFYGLVWDGGHLAVVEVYPGIGYDPVDRKVSPRGR